MTALVSTQELTLALFYWWWPSSPLPAGIIHYVVTEATESSLQCKQIWVSWDSSAAINHSQDPLISRLITMHLHLWCTFYLMVSHLRDLFGICHVGEVSEASGLWKIKKRDINWENTLTGRKTSHPPEWIKFAGLNSTYICANPTARPHNGGVRRIFKISCHCLILGKLLAWSWIQMATISQVGMGS